MKNAFRRILTAAMTILPSPVARFGLGLLGHKIAGGVRIGFSVVLVDRLYMGKGTSIGHLNFIRCRRILLRPESRIRHMNSIVGPISVWLDNRASVGNRNILKRAYPPVTYGTALLRLGTVSAITASHIVDCTKSVIFGNYTTLAGARSQIWTHGYYHYSEGIDRFRVDGRVVLGNNCYIGSGTIINAGVRVVNHVTVGSNSTISKDLLRSGIYVNQPMRYIDRNIEETLVNLEAISAPCCDRVYRKRGTIGAPQ